MAKVISFKEKQKEGSYDELVCPECEGTAWSLQIHLVGIDTNILKAVCLTEGCGFTNEHLVEDK